MSTSFTRENNGFSGTTHPTSPMYKKTMKCMSDLQKISDKDNITVNTVAEKVLSQSVPELEAYIRSRNEVPVDTTNGKILQAALLRMEDISTVSRAGNMSDADAAAHVFEAESEAYNQNTAEKGKILTPSTQAAIMVVYNNIMSHMKDRTGSETMGDALDLIRQTLSTPKDHAGTPAANNFSWGSIPDNFDIGAEFGPPTTSNVGVTVPTTDNGGDSSSSVWDLIGNVINNAGAISDAIKQIGGAGASAVNQVGGAVTNIGGNIGSDSISKYVSRNWVSILLFILAIAITIIIIVRVTKRK